MPYYCTVPRCTSMAGKAKNVSFHQFPRDEELAKLWNKILKRGKPYTKYSKVCSLHFTSEDYTITSVGKNKGQWRTLRKDAIPSQNLPSESPTPYQRKQWSSWARDPPSNIMDPTIHQQVAQAIYMQTMLAMQAAGTPDVSALSHSNGLPPIPPEVFAHTSTTPDTEILKGKQTNTHTKTNSFKCAECSKCFKDPDVFILHKRSHIKNEKNEKENFNLNLTLQANPILANLLKTNTENSNIFDTNFSMESFLMTALAANMEGYMRNFTSMIKGGERGREHCIGQSGRDDDDHSCRDRGHLGHDRGSCDTNDDKRDFQDCQSSSESVLNQNSTIHARKMNHSGSDRDLNDDRRMNSDRNVFSDRIIEHYRNNTYDNNRSVRYYENGDDSGCTKGDADFDRNVTGRGSEESDDDHINGDGDVNGSIKDCRRMVGHDKALMRSDSDLMDGDTYNGDGVMNDNDSQSSSDEPFCDNDLNESIDSNKLVIDETV